MGAPLLIVAMAGLIAGCSEPEQLSEQQAAALEQRVRARWQTLVDREFEQTWEFSTPAYREAFPKRLYPLKFSYAVEWELTGVEVLHYDAQAAVASVAVRVMSKPTKQTSAASVIIGAQPVTIREQWVHIGEEWWYSANR
ncbi:MAG: hypothetical protein DRQ97_02285 [Gammaproteobacteria bacterium]|nr:MAG: hypothetical protein DRQ97_02285 [Gammaproteobacteria bacterium]